MSSLPVRQRRLLSMDRRLGPQGAPCALDGLAQRHAQGWREINDPHVRAARGTVIGAALGAVMWGVLLMVMLHL